MAKFMFTGYLLRLFLLTVKLFIIYTLLFFAIPLFIMLIEIMENNIINFIISLIFIFLPFIIIYFSVDKDIKIISQIDIFPQNYKYYFPQKYKCLKLIVYILVLIFLLLILPIFSFTSAAKMQNYIYFHPHHKQENYVQITQFLEDKKWQEADKETQKIMLKITRRENKKWLSTRSLETFPCDALQTIDKLWINASSNKFGFTPQTEIWKQQNDGKINFSYKVDEQFKQKVGWNQIINESYLSQKQLSKSLPIGYFPSAVGTSLGKACVGSLDRLWFGQSVGCYHKIFIRIDECNK